MRCFSKCKPNNPHPLVDRKPYSYLNFLKSKFGDIRIQCLYFEDLAHLSVCNDGFTVCVSFHRNSEVTRVFGNDRFMFYWSGCQSPVRSAGMSYGWVHMVWWNITIDTHPTRLASIHFSKAVLLNVCSTLETGQYLRLFPLTSQIQNSSEVLHVLQSIARGRAVSKI